MELIERINLKQLHYLNSWSFQDFKQYVKSSCKNDEERKIQYNNLKNYCQSMIKVKGEIKPFFCIFYIFYVFICK